MTVQNSTDFVPVQELPQTIFSVGLTKFANAENRPLSKRIYLKDGKVEKESQGAMNRGEAFAMSVSSCTEMAAILDGLKSHEILTLGTIKHQQVNVITKPEYAKLLMDKPERCNEFIARSQEHVVFEDGKPSWMLLDIDRKGMPAGVADRIDAAGGIWPLLKQVFPALDGVGYIERPSTSSGIYHGLNKTEYPSSGGLHLYFRVREGTDIPRALKAMFQRLWLAGLGWPLISKAGSFLERSIIDASVGMPERPIFEGAPVVVLPLAQDVERRRALGHEGSIVDSTVAFPDLTAADQMEFQRIVGQAKNASAAKAEAVIEAIVRSEHDKTGVPIDVLTEQLKQAANQHLPPWFKLVLTNKSTITVADIWSDPKAYIGKTLYDPLEGVEYGHATAKILKGDTDGRPFIRSHAHGKVIYQLMSETKFRYVPGFQMMKGEGLFWIKEKAKKGKDEEDESDTVEKARVCNAFETLGQTFMLGEIEQYWGKLIRYTDGNKKSQTRIVGPDHMAMTPNTLFGMLSGMPLEPGSGRNTMDLFKRYMVGAKPVEKIAVANRTGWHLYRGEQIFVNYNYLKIKDDALDQVILADGVKSIANQRGTIADWNSEIGSIVRQHRLLTFGLCVALCGPFLHILGMPSFSAHIYGHSTIGKTTLAKVATSVWGNWAEGGAASPPTWNTTLAALEVQLRNSNDMFMVLDELSLGSPQVVDDAAYMIAGGGGKARSQSKGGLRDTEAWRVPMSVRLSHTTQ